jgi:BASS family bile acid:Na+ symporter
MDPKQIVLLAFQVSIAATVFGFGLGATREDLLYLWRRPTLFGRSLVSVLIVMPVVALVLAQIFDFRPIVEIALIALSISPIPPLLPGRMHKGGGDDAYGVSLLLWLSIIAIIVVPLASFALSAWFGQEAVAPPSKIARLMLVMVVVPMAAGAFVRARFPAIAARIERPLLLAAKVLLLLAAVALLAAAWRALRDAMGDGTIVAIVVFVVAGLAVGHYLGGPSRQTSVVLALSTACRHPVVALTIASASFPERHFGGTILLYVLVATLVALPYVMFQHRCEQPPATPTQA